MSAPLVVANSGPTFTWEVSGGVTIPAIDVNDPHLILVQIQELLL